MGRREIDMYFCHKTWNELGTPRHSWKDNIKMEKQPIQRLMKKLLADSYLPSNQYRNLGCEGQALSRVGSSPYAYHAVCTDTKDNTTEQQNVNFLCIQSFYNSTLLLEISRSICDTAIT
jgi:hypothetical protein